MLCRQRESNPGFQIVKLQRYHRAKSAHPTSLWCLFRAAVSYEKCPQLVVPVLVVNFTRPNLNLKSLNKSKNHVIKPFHDLYIQTMKTLRCMVYIWFLYAHFLTIIFCINLLMVRFGSKFLSLNQNLFNLIRSRIHNTWSTTLYFCTDIDFIMFWYEVFYFIFFLFVTVLCAQAHGISDSMWQMYRPLAYKDVWSIIPMLLRYQNIPWYFDFLRLQCCYSTVPTRAVDNFLRIRI